MPQSFSVSGVSYLNAKPLLYGLAEQADIRLTLDVPSRLIDGLRDESVDVALLPVIDYQKLAGLRIIPSGGIGCDGPTLTVRIFSNTPIPQITSLACDADSHTSVALARIILAERYGIHPRIFSGDAQGGEARLLIGDKVVCQGPVGMEHQLDLGEAWKELTGLPFVFAVWTARGGVDLGDLPGRLSAALRDGLNHIDAIISEHAVPRGWPARLARQYLGVNLQFHIGQSQLAAIARFHELAAAQGIIPSPAMPLKIV